MTLSKLLSVMKATEAAGKTAVRLHVLATLLFMVQFVNKSISLLRKGLHMT